LRQTVQRLALGLTAALLASSSSLAEVVARYVYDPASKSVVEQVKGERISPLGFFLASQAPKGPAIRLDGDTTIISGAAVERLTGGGPVTISAWVKLDALPWSETPIVDARAAQGRFFFGVDPYGHLVAERSGAGAPVRAVSKGIVRPRAWSLVTVSYQAGALTFSLDGVAAEGAPAAAALVAEGGAYAPLLIGRSRHKALPYPSQAIHPLLPVDFTLEGALGEIQIHDQVLSKRDLAALMKGVAPAQLAQAPAPPLPRWAGGAGPFGAFQTTLAYDPVWDSRRRVGPDQDVVVRFEHAPVQLVFWQGANYIPAWVTENGRWFSNQFMEIYGPPRCLDGEDCEPMSDKQVRYSHVEVVESTPARAVVHWRYALAEVEHGRQADPSPTGWGAWADEYWTVYPDGVAIRRQVLWTDHPQREASEFQESIVIIPAGQTPEENINLDALTLANLAGQSKSYSWAQRTANDLAKPRGPDQFEGLADPMIQWINLRSQWKPFSIVNAGPAKFSGINWEPSMSSFEWWNHWPVSQMRSSGRPALTSDRPSHSSLSHIFWPIAAKDDQRLTRLLMTGLTQGDAASLAPAARAWVQSPPARLLDAGSVRFDQAQRAFVVEGAAPGRPVRIEILADEAHPAINPAIVAPNWSGRASVSVDGAPLSGARLGYVDKLEGRTLVAYLPLEAKARLTITLTPEP
jgi:hypothetical protein